MPLSLRPNFALAALLFFSAVLARAEIEFAGILVTSEKTQFRLIDPSSAVPPAWVSVGQTFAGHEIRSYDAKRDVLTLAKNHALIEVRLKDAKVQPGRAVVIAGAVTLGRGEKLAVPRATLLFGQLNSFPLRNGVVCHIKPTRLPDGNIQYAMSFERLTADGQAQRISAPSVICLPGAPFSIRIGGDKPSDDDLSVSFTPESG
ncbi:MAG: hypothetical protein NTV51_32170 [Verrucomicrobia bacterium]|nr:hypothetical protein [Verrucomicrobiota bacterium]